VSQKWIHKTFDNLIITTFLLMVFGRDDAIQLPTNFGEKFDSG